MSGVQGDTQDGTVYVADIGIIQQPFDQPIYILPALMATLCREIKIKNTLCGDIILITTSSDCLYGDEGIYRRRPAGNK